MMVLDDGSVYSFGHPDQGALGHGSDGKYIISTGREGFREVLPVGASAHCTLDGKCATTVALRALLVVHGG